MRDVRPMTVDLPHLTLAGDLATPAQPSGLVVFAHGSGSSRHSPRNRFVANALNERGFATLLLDLLTFEEEMLDARTGEYRFDIGLLGRRMCGVTDWLSQEEPLRDLPVGYFGASTGAAGALIAAAARPTVRAVVSRGGRPDLAGDVLARVSTPTLLIVGGADVPVIALNRRALARLAAARLAVARLEIVPGATHLFEEPGALEDVAALAADWFATYLRGGVAARRVS